MHINAGTHARTHARTHACTHFLAIARICSHACTHARICYKKYIHICLNQKRDTKTPIFAFARVFDSLSDVDEGSMLGRLLVCVFGASCDLRTAAERGRTAASKSPSHSKLAGGEYFSANTVVSLQNYLICFPYYCELRTVTVATSIFSFSFQNICLHRGARLPPS